MKHLLAIKNKGGDVQHPIDDGLWDNDFTKYLMMPRPGKYSVGKRKRSHQKAARRAYQKKKRRETEMGQVYRQRFDQDKLSAAEYRKILTGANRRRFDEEQRVKERVEAMQAANDQILQQRLQQKIAELQSSNALGVQDARIQELEYLQTELSKKNDVVSGTQSQLARATTDVAEFYTAPRFIESNSSVFDHHNYEPPRTPSVEAFYEFATLLHPPEEWSTGVVFDDGSIRRMKTVLRQWVDSTKRKLSSDDEREHIDGFVSVFQSSCDCVVKERDINAKRSEIMKERWFTDQDTAWMNAQTKFFGHFPVAQKPFL